MKREKERERGRIRSLSLPLFFLSLSLDDRSTITLNRITQRETNEDETREEVCK